MTSCNFNAKIPIYSRLNCQISPNTKWNWFPGSIDDCHNLQVFLYGESLIVYRVFRNERKKFSKTLHVCLHSVVLVFMIIALKVSIFLKHMAYLCIHITFAWQANREIESEIEKN